MSEFNVKYFKIGINIVTYLTMKLKLRTLFYYTFHLLFFLNCSYQTEAQEHTIARDWNEAILESIRNDYARPTVHARNLFHLSIVMHDAWAAYEPGANTYLLGKEYGGFVVPYEPIDIPTDSLERVEAQKMAISFAAYRLLTWRFRLGFSPAWLAALVKSNQIMIDNNYNYDNTSTNYASGGPAALGNYIAEKMIDAGMIDGSNENFSYSNLYYDQLNTPLVMDLPGNPDMTHPNNWQQLQLEEYIDQAGNPVLSIPEFLSPEWGNVTPFALTDADKTVHSRDGNTYNVYHDPGLPPLLDTAQVTGLEDLFKWNFTLVNRWSAHHDHEDGVLWDISPASLGNIQTYPTDFADYASFYNVEDGGDYGIGHTINPFTNQPYQPQVVPRGDYTRVLAEFWADGPDSETPPGHWFTIANYVNENPNLIKRWQGQGEVLDDLEWDIKTYLTLGGAMHDAAITAWGCKGWYDYVRPVSAIRYMAEKGQSSDPNLPNFHPAGFPLIPNYIELVEAGDPLLLDSSDNLGKVKLRSWRGPDFIIDPETDMAGVGWILAEEWWPYQRPSFVSPPFAGYVSGHSTYSRAAAEVLTAITGDPFFPGGMGEFPAPQNEFLVFEEGPSVDLTLQWATYRDASDQCSLSRIWGGIHPPVDDIPGRFMGEKVGLAAFEKANNLFNSTPETFSISVENVWLEGFYDATANIMTNNLVNEALVPLEQSYDTDPWNYTGQEGLLDYPAEFIDWILLCLRDTDGNILSAKACCLNNDGSVYDKDGNEIIEFNGFDNAQTYILSIHHRNHLAIGIDVQNNTIIDLNNNSDLYGISPTKIVDGLGMMYAGDFDGNGIINNLDFNIWATDNVVVDQYVSQDADGNGIVNNLDYNLWVNNRSKVGENIIQY